MEKEAKNKSRINCTAIVHLIVHTGRCMVMRLSCLSAIFFGAYKHRIPPPPSATITFRPNTWILGGGGCGNASVLACKFWIKSIPQRRFLFTVYSARSHKSISVGRTKCKKILQSTMAAATFRYNSIYIGCQKSSKWARAHTAALARGGSFSPSSRPFLFSASLLPLSLFLSLIHSLVMPLSRFSLPLHFVVCANTRPNR